ncbi:MAG: HAD-IC family P-type ATPase [Bacillota bacterium]|nr:HAD-IC family P-type ATPase [Bacillota bacterium]
MARLAEGTWHVEEGARVAQLHLCDLQKGLPAELARERLEQLGRNELPSPPGRSLLSMFLDQIKEILVLLLIGAAVISALLGEVTDAAVILFIVLLNATLGVLQEHRAEKSLAALKRLSQPYARVVRSGRLQQIPVAEVVPGDLILLEAGDYVPADARLVEVATLKVDESALTGESIPVEKTAAALPEADLPLGDRKNLVFRGTMVTYGRGKAVVTSTGVETELGRIAALIQETPREETPLQKRLGELGGWLGGLAIALVVLVFLAGIWHGQPALEMFMTAVSLAVAAIPEGLPAIVTIVLALGVQRMARRRAIIRKLPAVETLGTATVICSDKTGTLTQNQMTVQKIYVDGRLIQVTGEGYEPRGKFLLLGTEEPLRLREQPELLFLLGAAALASDARLEKTNGRYRLIGDPTEGALVVAAAKAGLFKQRLDRLYPRVGEIPFDAARKRMTTFHRTRDGLPPRLPGAALDWLPEEGACAQAECTCVAFTKGAPDILLARCTHLLAGGEVRPLEESERTRLLQLNGRLAEEALRVLAGLTATGRERPLLIRKPWSGT